MTFNLSNYEKNLLYFIVFNNYIMTIGKLKNTENMFEKSFYEKQLQNKKNLLDKLNGWLNE